MPAIKQAQPPEGFRYQTEILPLEEEQELLFNIRRLPLKEFEFHGYVGKRRTISFGWHYDIGQEKLKQTDEIPFFVLKLREHAAVFSGLAAAEFLHALVTEYSPGTTIGWHRDKGVFEKVIGISLLSPCNFRFRRKAGSAWERYSQIVEPRSAYLLDGESRTTWEHSIPAVDALLYSVTFRSLRKSSKA